VTQVTSIFNFLAFLCMDSTPPAPLKTMVATGYRSHVWKVADDWEVVEGIKESPSEVSDGYPASLEGVMIEAMNEESVPLDESFSITADGSGDGDDDDSSYETCSEASGSGRFMAVEEEDVGRGRDGRGLIVVEARDDVDNDDDGNNGNGGGGSDQTMNLMSNLNIDENIQDFANAARSKAIEANVMVSSMVRVVGIHMGLSNLFGKQFGVSTDTTTSKKKTKTMTMSSRASPIIRFTSHSNELLTATSDMDETTYTEFIRSSLSVEVGDDTRESPESSFSHQEVSYDPTKRIDYHKTSQQSDDTPSSSSDGAPVIESLPRRAGVGRGGGPGRVHAVRVLKARGRSLMRVISTRGQSTPVDRGIDSTGVRANITKNGKQTPVLPTTMTPRVESKMTTVSRNVANVHRSSTPNGDGTATASTPLRPWLKNKQQTQTKQQQQMQRQDKDTTPTMVEVVTKNREGGGKKKDGAFYKVVGSTVTPTGPMKQTSATSSSNNRQSTTTTSSNDLMKSYPPRSSFLSEWNFRSTTTTAPTTTKIR